MAVKKFPLDQEADRIIQGVGDTDIEAGSTEDTTLPGELVENADGSAQINMPEDKKPKNGGAFDDNLAEEMEETELGLIAKDLLERIEIDQKARELRDKQYAEGIRRSGLGNDAPGGADFEGASRAVHPALAETCVDFCASASRELFPPNGPAKSKIEGKVTKEKMEIAERQVSLMNWQCTKQISEYIDEHEQMLTQLPMGGSQYIKFWPDSTLGRVACQFVPIDNMFIPFHCADFYSASRITHAQHLSKVDYEDRIASGMYKEIPLPTEQSPEQTKAATASDKVEGKTQDQENIDEVRIVFECNTFYKLKIDGDERKPYLISIDDRTRKIVAIYRNWEERDSKSKRLHWIVEYGFIPWRGAYKIGLPQLIGGLSISATGALRALLDAAHVQNFPGMVKLKAAGRMSGQSKKLNAASITEIEAGANVDDIKKLAMQLQYGGPSPVLFQLLGWLTDAIKGVVTTAEEKIADASNQMPVGTALALMESGAKVFSSIHARLHRSQERALGIIARINRTTLDEQDQMEQLGEVLATQQDFQAGLFVIPVSDPNIFAESQRYAQMQMVLQLASQPATAPLHKLYAVVHRIYTIAKIPDIDEILPKPPEPVEMNFVAENMAILMGRPAMAFPEQDHIAHIEGHMRVIIDPFLGSSPGAVMQTYPKMIEHLRQHFTFMYGKLMYETASEALGMPVEQLMQQEEQQQTQQPGQGIPAQSKMSNQLDSLMQSASKIVHAKMLQMFQPLGPQIEQLIQQVMKMQPPPPMDATAGAIQIAKMDQQTKQGDQQAKQQDLAARERVDQANVQIKQAAQAHTQQLDTAELELQRQEEERKQRETDAKSAIEIERLQRDTQHQALQLEEARIPGQNNIPGA